jgi:transcriptional regulator with XRE-family HTH domain
MKKSVIVAASQMVLMKAKHPTAREIKEFRDRLGLTQKQFAGQFGIPLGTIRRWEQEQNTPRRTNAIYTLWRKLARTHRSPKQQQVNQSHESDESHPRPGKNSSSNILVAAMLPFYDQQWLDIQQAGSAVVSVLGA